MSNRNFDFSAIVNILNSQNAGNFYNRQQRLVNTISTIPAQIQVQPANPQTANSDADTVPTIRAGQQAYYFKNGTTTTIMSPQNYLPMPTVPTNFTILVFSTVGTTTWKAPLLTNTLTYLVVGGGGGGGNGYTAGGGGGGGAGMVVTGTLAVVPNTYYTVTIGEGGAGAPATPPLTNQNGSSGSVSVFSSIIALGGAPGYGSRTLPGGAGVGGAAQVGTTTASQGGNGGNGVTSAVGGSGGGGGGAGGVGGNGTGAPSAPVAGGAGGAGVSSALSGSSVTYGVGGAGAKGNTNVTAADGSANTGNGGGGGGQVTGTAAGGTGGSGIVIITFFQ
jgi:hypothetical protein